MRGIAGHVQKSIGPLSFCALNGGACRASGQYDPGSIQSLAGISPGEPLKVQMLKPWRGLERRDTAGDHGQQQCRRLQAGSPCGYALLAWWHHNAA